MQAKVATLIIRLPAVALTGLLVALFACPLTLSAAAAEPKPVKPDKPDKPDKAEKDKPDAPPADDKPKGPDHNVTLAEEQGVLDLLKKAQKARAKAETDASVWPECVKYYAEILKKYPNSVYLEKWEGPEKAMQKEPDNDPFKNGLYKSTRDRVASDIANLPRGGLEIYRAINDPPAKALFQEAQNRVDERKMEQVAIEYASTSVGLPAMSWLAEVSYDSGARRQAIARIDRVLKDEASKPQSSGLLTRKLLSYIHVADATGAQNTLKDLNAASQDPANGPVRVGHAEGKAALDALAAQVAALTAGGAAAPAAQNSDAASRSLDTYFGNAAHNRVPPPRSSVGVSRWSVSLNQLLYGPNADLPGSNPNPNPNNPEVPNLADIPTLNHQLIAHEGYFYLCDSQLVVAYPIGNPTPGVPSVGGNAKFVWPTDQEVAGAGGSRRHLRNVQQGMGIYQHPYFCTIANERLYMVCGPDPVAMDPNMWRGMEQKSASNFLVALGRQHTGGTVESGKLVWTLKPDSPTFLSHSKADQEWLKSVYFVSAPTCENGVLYGMAVHLGGTNEAWVAAFDAETGRMLWHTMVCSANPIFVGGAVQPDIGLPVTVANGTVYICTNLGAVAALDALGGTIRWIRVYDRVKVNPNRWNNDPAAMASDFWGPNPPIIYKNLLIVTPQDSDMLYAYYTEDGKSEKGTPYEMGQRKYHIERVKHAENTEVGGFKHVLGIVNGNLAITGSRVHFFDAWSGKISGPGEAIATDSPIFGRGLVTEDMVFVPTDKSLVRIDATLVKDPAAGDKERFTAKLRDEFKWAHPKEEAGNLFIAGDVLYTVSHTHVNAFFVWEDMERKYKEKIAAAPGELQPYVELADVYIRVEHFDQALATLKQGEAEAEKAKSDPKIASALARMRAQRFDTLKSLGEREHGDKAYAYFKQAYETSQLPDLGKELPVIALNLLAENALTRGDAATAVGHYQEILVKYGDVIYAFVKNSSSRARLYAQSRIEEIRRKNPESYAKVDAEASAALGKAGNDAAALETIVAIYPNSTASRQALLKLAQLALATDPDRARQNARRYLSRAGSSPDAVLGLALLEAGLERSRMLAAAQDVLYRIDARGDAAEVKLDFDPLSPETKLPAPTTVKEWAKARLADKLFKGSPSAATYALGREKPKSAWTRPIGQQSQAVAMQGLVPQDMRGNLFYIENQSELAVLSGRDGGQELWDPRPKLPVNCRAIAYWADRQMVVFGDAEIVALDSKEKGKVVWRYTLRAPLQLPPLLSADGQKLVVAYPTGALSVVDASSGNELWYMQVDGAVLASSPAVGDNCVAFAAGTPPKMVIYDLDTQAKRGAIELSNGGLTAGPVIQGDRLYIAEHNNKIRSYDTTTGKLLWEQACDAEVKGFYTTREYLFAMTPSTAEKKIRAFKTQTPLEGNRAAWWLDISGNVMDVRVDGDDLYVVVSEPGKSQGRATKVKSYSIPKQGKFQWETDASAEFSGVLSMSDSLVTAHHLVLTQSNWDPTGAKASAVVLVDRRTGKLTWDQTLASDPMLNADGTHSTYTIQLFEGGLAVSEARRRTSFVSPDADAGDTDTKALDARYEKNPEDADLALRWARNQYDKGEHEKALGALAKALAAAPNDDRFSQIYDVFAKMRRDNAIKAKSTLKFAKFDKAPKLDGNLDDWKPAAATEQKFDSWRDVYLTSEQVPGAPSRKNTWKGASDLSVSFRGGYDEKNIYILLAVKDDIQKNDQSEGQLIDLGDSALLMFDSNNDGGVGFRGEEFSLGGGLTKAGAPVGWRWVEHGKFVSGKTPIESGIFAARNEAEKTTVYEFALPLESLALKAEPGKQFGFAFTVLDQDQDDGSPEKGVGSSPGVLTPPEPRLFSKGEFQK